MSLDIIVKKRISVGLLTPLKVFNMKLFFLLAKMPRPRTNLSTFYFYYFKHTFFLGLCHPCFFLFWRSIEHVNLLFAIILKILCIACLSIFFFIVVHKIFIV